MPMFVCYLFWPFVPSDFAAQILRTLLRIPLVFVFLARAEVVDGCNPHAILRKAIALPPVS